MLRAGPEENALEQVRSPMPDDGLRWKHTQNTDAAFAVHAHAAMLWESLHSIV